MAISADGLSRRRDAWLQSYLAWSDALERFVDKSGLDAKNAQRARFALSLVTDAFAPTDVWLGNPAGAKAPGTYVVEERGARS